MSKKTLFFIIITTYLVTSIFIQAFHHDMFIDQQIEQQNIEIQSRSFFACLDNSVEIIKPSSQWSQVESFFGKSINGSGITIAVLDTGIDATHLDLDDLDDNASSSDPKIIGSISFVSGEDSNDYNGHGTHVAGIIAGTGNASSGQYQGVALGAQLLNVKVLNSSAIGLEENITDGIDWAVSNGADIISMSLGSDTVGNGSDAVSQKIDWAVSQGVIVVVAAGKISGHYNVTIPGVASQAITVGATDDSDNLYVNNPYGPTSDFRLKPEVIAPGVNIISCRASLPPPIGTPIDGNYTQVSGTSMATGHVSGAIALLLQANPSWNQTEILSALMDTGKQVDSNLYKQGGGRINCSAAINQTFFSLNASLSFGKIPWGNFTSKNVVIKNLLPQVLTLDISVNNTKFFPSTNQLIIPALSQASFSVYFFPIFPTDISHQFALLNVSGDRKTLLIPLLGTCPGILSNWSLIENSTKQYSLTGRVYLDDWLNDHSIYNLTLKDGTNILNHTSLNADGYFFIDNLTFSRGLHHLSWELRENGVLIGKNQTTKHVLGYNSSFSISPSFLIAFMQGSFTLISDQSLSGLVTIYYWASGWHHFATAQFTNGVAHVSLNMLHLHGQQTLKFVYEGDENHEPITILTTVHVQPNVFIPLFVLIILIACTITPISIYRYRKKLQKQPTKRTRIMTPQGVIKELMEKGNYKEAAARLKTLDETKQEMLRNSISLNKLGVEVHGHLLEDMPSLKKKELVFHARQFTEHCVNLEELYKKQEDDENFHQYKTLRTTMYKQYKIELKNKEK